MDFHSHSVEFEFLGISEFEFIWKISIFLVVCSVDLNLKLKGTFVWIKRCRNRSFIDIKIGLLGEVWFGNGIFSWFFIKNLVDFNVQLTLHTKMKLHLLSTKFSIVHLIKTFISYALSLHKEMIYRIWYQTSCWGN